MTNSLPDATIMYLLVQQERVNQHYVNHLLTHFWASNFKTNLDTNLMMKLYKTSRGKLRLKLRIQLSITLKMIGLMTTIGFKMDPTVLTLSILLAGTIRV